MPGKRERQRLEALFSDIEVLIVDPAGNTLEMSHGPEGPPSPIAELEAVLLEPENDTVEVDAAPLDKPFTADELSAGAWKDVGIGLITGLTVTGIILVSTSQIQFFTKLERLALLGFEIFCSVIGALVAKSSGRGARDIWVGAIQGSLVPLTIVLVLLFLFIFLM